MTHALERLCHRLEAAAGATVWALAVAVGALVTFVDWATGPEISFSIFYLLPVALVAWTRSLRAGLVSCAVSAAAWFVADRLTGHLYSHSLIALWNALVRFGFFAIVTVLLGFVRRSLEEESWHARTDTLTGLATRRHFYDVADREIERARGGRRPFTLAYVDIDEFKAVNDRLGHSAGDEVLRLVGEILRTSVRGEDLVSRIGGDEFVVLLRNAPEATALSVLERVQARLRTLARERGWPISFSVGAATFTTPPADVDSAIRAADVLMYEIKGAGKDGIRHAHVSAAGR